MREQPRERLAIEFEVRNHAGKVRTKFSQRRPRRRTAQQHKAILPGHHHQHGAFFAVAVLAVRFPLEGFAAADPNRCVGLQMHARLQQLEPAGNRLTCRSQLGARIQVIYHRQRDVGIVQRATEQHRALGRGQRFPRGIGPPEAKLARSLDRTCGGQALPARNGAASEFGSARQRHQRRTGDLAPQQPPRRIAPEHVRHHACRFLLLRDLNRLAVDQDLAPPIRGKRARRKILTRRIKHRLGHDGWIGASAFAEQQRKRGSRGPGQPSLVATFAPQAPNLQLAADDVRLDDALVDDARPTRNRLIRDLADQLFANALAEIATLRHQRRIGGFQHRHLEVALAGRELPLLAHLDAAAFGCGDGAVQPSHRLSRGVMQREPAVASGDHRLRRRRRWTARAAADRRDLRFAQADLGARHHFDLQVGAEFEHDATFDRIAGAQLDHIEACGHGRSDLRVLAKDQRQQHGGDHARLQGERTRLLSVLPR